MEEKEIIPDEDITVEDTAKDEAEKEQETPPDTEEVTEEPEVSADEAKEIKEEKKGFFKKKEKKDKKDEMIEELTDKVRRTMAEFDNFRKRTEKEKSAMFEVGAKSVIEKLLPVVDNFERGLAAVPEEEQGSAFV